MLPFLIFSLKGGVYLVMKLTYSICCGVDVHKKVLVATIVSTDRAGIPTYQQRSFSTINCEIRKFHNWLIENNCYHVCMESTGKYWIPIFNYLEADIDVCLTHPKYVKAIKGKKTDKKDSKWIADLYRFDLVRNSFIPPKPIRELREISRYRYKLVCMKSSEKNRKKDPYFAIKYQRIKKRRGHKKAIIAIARMMLLCINHMISEQKPFHPTDYEELMDPRFHKDKVVLNDANVLAYLEQQGYDLSTFQKRNES